MSKQWPAPAHMPRFAVQVDGCLLVRGWGSYKAMMAEQESNQCTYYCSFNTFRAGCIESSVGQYPLSELSIGHTIISSPAECIYAIYLYRYLNCSRRLAGPGLVTRSDRCTILRSASELGSNRSLYFTTNGASQPVPTSYSRISDLLYYLLSCHFVSGRASFCGNVRDFLLLSYVTYVTWSLRAGFSHISCN